MKAAPILMFHHFCDRVHPRGQGAIDAGQFRQILERQTGLLSADVWLDRARRSALGPGDTCVSLDDGLKCQLDVALPVLEELRLRAFWFPHTAVLDNRAEPIEVQRYLRTVLFDNIADFYVAFFRCYEETFGESELAGVDFDAYLAEFAFYTRDDRRFRYIRDNLAPSYDVVMSKLLAEHDLDEAEMIPRLWMSAEDLRHLHRAGHIIGLHSHSHPVRIARLPVDEQRREYQTNLAMLRDRAGIEEVSTVAHPCNSYSGDTLAVLEELDIQFGFRSNAALASFTSLELPRLDHHYLVS